MIGIKYSLLNVLVFAGALLAWNDFCFFFEIDAFIDRNGVLLILGLAFAYSLNHPIKFRKYLGKFEYLLYLVAFIEICKFLGLIAL